MDPRNKHNNTWEKAMFATLEDGTVALAQFKNYSQLQFQVNLQRLSYV